MEHLGGSTMNNLGAEIAFLESMFDGTVSPAVISSVLESCNGNVHLAADAIMNFSEEMCTPQCKVPPGEDKELPKKTEEPPKENKEMKSVEVHSTLNVDATPFEFRPSNSSSDVGASRQYDVPRTPSLDRLTIAGREFPLMLQPPSSPILQATSDNMQLQGTAYRPLPNVMQESTSYSIRNPLAALVNQEPTLKVNEQSASSTSPLLSTAEAISMSSLTLRNSGTIHKKPPDLKSKGYTMKASLDQVGNIIHLHNNGTRTIIIMRGASGSGKTYLAKHIVDYTVGASSQNYDRHIFSTDSYYMRGGVYQFNRNTLEQAHSMNQRRVCDATNNGVSPIIVDNTNTELWEMEPYIRDGVRNGYVIEFLEPNNAWSRNANQLANRNVHGVSRDSIRRMLDRYDRRITPETAMRALRLEYPQNRMPPQLRNIPPFSPPLSPRDSPKRRNPNDGNQGSNAINKNPRQESPGSSSEQTGSSENRETKNGAGDGNAPVDDTMKNDEYETKLKKIIEAQKEIEQFEKVEQEWENGESWDATTETYNNRSQNSTCEPKPPRRPDQIDDDAEKLIKSSNICDDWTKISMFMPPWQNEGSTSSQQTRTVDTSIDKEKTSVGTGFEVTDMNELMHNVLYGIPRNINENMPKNPKTKIPLVVMLDKSTSTHENDILSNKEVCKNTESHFRELRRMFRSVPREVLRDIFESCNFDVNWAVNLVLDSYPDSQKDMDLPKDSDSEDEEAPVVECNCLASYNIIPDVTPAVDIAPVPEPETLPSTPTPASQKKAKRDNKLSDNTLQLKRQIESNVLISDNHYSQHYLNIRRRRDPNIDRGDESTASTSKPYTEDNVQTNNRAIPEREVPKWDIAGPSTTYFDTMQFTDADFGDSDTESDSNKSDNPEQTVTINMGEEFISKLDFLFGRSNFQYPDNVHPVLTLPMSLLKQLNAHWAMSVAYQLDEESRQSIAIIKQDEEFARRVAAQEQEMSDEGKEPDTPSLKEIMDMELAYAIYERSISEWRNNEPQDLAAKLTREKLFNLFPDISKVVLSEMLMAHDYSFKATVETLIISTGQAKWLEQEKGIEKFVMAKEMERKERFMEEQKKTLDETEWPYLSNPDKPITLETVNFYRSEADKSLQCRNQNFEKARQYYARNSPAAASFYSDIAALHTRRYEQSSCLAAAYLMNYHLKNNPDHDVLDLHYLRVSEAIINLDIFLDQMIVRIRSKNLPYKETWIITGKGMHSVGGPKIKPAVKKHLKTREITFKQINGGLIMATLLSSNKLTSELPSEKS